MKPGRRLQDDVEPDVEHSTEFIVQDGLIDRGFADQPPQFIEAEPGWETRRGGPFNLLGWEAKCAHCERCREQIFIVRDHDEDVVCNACVKKARTGESQNQNEWIDEWREREERRIEAIMEPGPRAGYTGGEPLQ